MMSVKKPEPKDFGWIESEGFESEPGYWAYEEGEKKYEKAMAEWAMRKVLEEHNDK
jgi:hypothetical protein